MGVVSLFNIDATSTTADDQGRWRQFILDHLDYIAIRSQMYVLEPEVMNIYRYDLRRFLKDRLTRQMDMAWIVQLLNDIPSDLDFDITSKIIVPDDSLILKLYHIYISRESSQE